MSDSSPKIPGMFGTLVICLPSAHRGGDVIVKHRHEKETLRSSESAQSFMCWYSDVQHEVLPVTSGYRWVLTYNLALDPSAEPPSARLLRADTSLLRRALGRWLAEAAGSQQPPAGFQHLRPLIYSLDHLYTEAGISLKALKGRDATVVQGLRDISSELPMDVFLGILEKADTGLCESADDKGFHHMDPFDDIIETTFSIKTLVDLDGVHLADNIGIKEENLLHDCFEGVDSEEIHYEEGYSGNEVSNCRFPTTKMPSCNVLTYPFPHREAHVPLMPTSLRFVLSLLLLLPDLEHGMLIFLGKRASSSCRAPPPCPSCKRMWSTTDSMSSARTGQNRSICSLFSPTSRTSATNHQWTDPACSC